ncbi:MAG: hypothetical protein M1819_001781 [Sarea resinae]|nr:MAG: hypothetical protein M1819_001781 [Sarea resinae]
MDHGGSDPEAAILNREDAQAVASEDGEEAAGGIKIDGGDDASDEAGSEPEEYVVEQILDHKGKGSSMRFLVKWQGYDRKEDQTWEPEENLEGAKDILSTYLDSIGGRPAATKAGPKRGRASTSGIETNGGAKRRKSVKDEPSASPKAKDWKPPSGSWEDDVMSIDTVEQTPKGLFVYLVWNDHRKSQHPIEVVYKRCPLKVL